MSLMLTAAHYARDFLLLNLTIIFGSQFAVLYLQGKSQTKTGWTAPANFDG
jgi:hypothetical protein